MHGMSLQKVMLPALQGGMRLLVRSKSSFIEDDSDENCSFDFPVVCIGKNWRIKSVVGERCTHDAV